MAAKHAIEQGAFVRADDFQPAKCPVSGSPALRYEPPLRATRAMRAIASGECVASAGVANLPMLAPGQKVIAVTALGAVMIERSVEALQSAYPGQRLFVRGADGVPYSVRYEEVTP